MIQIWLKPRCNTKNSSWKITRIIPDSWNGWRKTGPSEAPSSGWSATTAWTNSNRKTIWWAKALKTRKRITLLLSLWTSLILRRILRHIRKLKFSKNIKTTWSWTRVNWWASSVTSWITSTTGKTSKRPWPNKTWDLPSRWFLLSSKGPNNRKTSRIPLSLLSSKWILRHSNQHLSSLRM